MSKRKQRKEEEARVLRELDQAVAAEKEQAAEGENAEKATARPAGEFIPTKREEVFHCKRCKTKLEKGVCPTCGYKMYQPMTEEQRKKIRRIVAVVCVGIFLVAFIALKVR